MKTGFLCQVCGVEAACRRVSLHQNIGMLFMRRSKSLSGMLCKRCIHSNFWKMTGTTVAVGWLGTISLVMTPFLVINNIVHYIGSAGLPATPADAKPPVIDNTVTERLFPKIDSIISRLNGKEDFEQIALDVANETGVTPGQVQAYTRQVIRAAQQRQQAMPGPRGFPVAIPAPAIVGTTVAGETST